LPSAVTFREEGISGIFQDKDGYALNKRKIIRKNRRERNVFKKEKKRKEKREEMK